MIHYERWMSLPTIVLMLFAIAALAMARQNHAPHNTDTWLRLGALASGLALCSVGFVYGLTDHYKTRHWPIVLRLVATTASIVGLMLLWRTLAGTPEELRSMFFRTMDDPALVEKRASIDATFKKIDKWRVALAVAGIGVLVAALAVVDRAPRTEPPSTEESLGWLLFLCGLSAIVPLFRSLFTALKEARSQVKGI